MPRAGPKRTIPSPVERPASARRWPTQALVGAAVIVAIFLLLRWMNAGEGPVEGVPDAEPARPESQAAAPGAPAPADGPRAAQASAPDPKFLARLQRNSARRWLRDTPYSADVVELVAAARIREAATVLESGSAAGDGDSTVVLTQLQMLCQSPDTVRRQAGEPPALASALETELARAAPVPADLRARIEASAQADRETRARLERACRDTSFNTSAIVQRLRSAADNGHEPSLWALGRYFDDAQQRSRHWLSAAMLGYPPAQADLAASLLEESLQGDRRNRGQMNFWLQTAAKHSPAIKAQLGECILNGCNAQPPDTGAAAALLREATLLGEGAALDALATISRSDPLAPSEEELYGLQSFLQRLNETGCYGTAGYPVVALKSLRSLREIGRGLSPHNLDDAEKLGAARWHNHSTAARRAQHCE
jgi:TPR repeat protein